MCRAFGVHFFGQPCSLLCEVMLPVYALICSLRRTKNVRRKRIRFYCCKLSYIIYLTLYLLLLVTVISAYMLFVAEFKFDGFSVDTCKSLLAMKDVSFFEIQFVRYFALLLE